MQFELREIQNRIGTTVVYVTHDQEEALVLADRIAVMKDGGLEQVGAPEVIYHNPGNGFVAAFIGESNRVRVNLTDSGEYLSAADPLLALRVPGSDLTSGVFVVRPEDVNVTVNQDVIPSQHLTYEATVEDLVFVGDHVRVKVRLHGATTWVAKIGFFDPELASIRNATSRGEGVWVHWAIDRGRVLRDDSIGGAE